MQATRDLPLFGLPMWQFGDDEENEGARTPPRASVEHAPDEGRSPCQFYHLLGDDAPDEDDELEPQAEDGAALGGLGGAAPSASAGARGASAGARAGASVGFDAGARAGASAGFGAGEGLGGGSGAGAGAGSGAGSDDPILQDTRRTPEAIAALKLAKNKTPRDDPDLQAMPLGPFRTLTECEAAVYAHSEGTGMLKKPYKSSNRKPTKERGMQITFYCQTYAQTA